MKPINYKEQLINIGKGLAFILILYAVIIYFKLKPYQIVVFIGLVYLVFLWWKEAFSWRVWLGTVAYVAVLIYTLKYLVYFFGNAGYFLGIALICGAILYKRRKEWLKAKHHIESMLWGKPLKDFRTSKDIPKIKIGKK